MDYYICMAEIIDGKAISKKVREEVAREVEKLMLSGIIPTLHVVLVGDDPASKIYVRNKEKAAKSVGIHTKIHHLPSEVKQERVLDLITTLNEDKGVNGILVQLPLPEHLDKNRVLNSIDPLKDVDGLHPENLGLLFAGTPRLIPCTPQGIMRMIGETGYDITGKEAVVIGRSLIVGKPVAHLLLEANATVTMIHSRSKDITEHTKRADILVVAVGKPGFIKQDMVKPGSMVIDVGINRTASGKLVGDVDFKGVSEVAGWITPVPGGVGPMTVAMLLKNTVQATYLQTN